MPFAPSGGDLMNYITIIFLILHTFPCNLRKQKKINKLLKLLKPGGKNIYFIYIFIHLTYDFFLNCINAFKIYCNKYYIFLKIYIKYRNSVFFNLLKIYFDLYMLQAKKMNYLA